jgi:lipopolysaccharide/colanic/teichoic acid biosynthesis glycosyltransferase
MPATAWAEPRRTKLRARDQLRGHRHILTQELFKDVLIRERKRADRFGEPVLLLLIELDNIAKSLRPASDVASKSSWIWMKAMEALTAAAGGTALAGWFERQAVLGAVVPETCGADPETLVRRELARRLDAPTIARFSIWSHVYSPTSAQREEWLVADPFFVRRRSPDYRRTARDGIKRGLDVAGSLAVLLIMSPVLFLIAALLKLTSPGPILFRQVRVGQMAKPFTMLKFRTMRVNADPGLHHEFVTKFIKSSAQLHPAGRKVLFKLTNDPQVTPLGRILRKTSLDELPQFWNVLRGDMSLVGPRPPLAYEVEQYQPWHWRRVMDAKPGITGLWQVGGRSRTTFDEMVRLDLRYARNCSLWTDIKILLATPQAVISGKGAG